MYRTALFTTLTTLTLLATSVRGSDHKQTPEELTADSDVVVIGTVDLKASYWGDDSNIYTDVTITPDLAVKGSQAGPVVVRLLGGVVGDTRMTISDAPEFEEGERAVVFLKRHDGIFHVAGRAAGKYAADSADALDAVDRALTHVEQTTGRSQFQKRSRALSLLANPSADALTTTTTTTTATSTGCYLVDGAKWATTSATYRLGPSIPTAWYAALNASATTWSNSGVNFRLVNDSTSVNELSLADLVAKYGSSYSNTYAVATTWSTVSTNQITKATIEINNKWQWSTSGEANKADVQNILTHEFGHWMRLKDLYSPSTCSEVTMWGSAMLGETKKRTLEADDIAGFQSLYGGGPSTSVAAPTLLAPGNSATGVSTAATLSWTATAGATSYDVYFGTGSTPSFVATVSGTAYAPGTLSLGVTYYWRVIAKNSSTSASSPTWAFTTAASANVAAPVLTSPANNATGVSTTPALTWTASAGATSYDVYFGAGSNMAFVASVNGTTYNPGTLSAGTVYRWRVEAKNSTSAASSPTFTFTTAAATGLAASVLLSPANGATGVSLAPVFRWNPVSGATYYDVYVGTTSTPAYIGTVTYTSVTVSGFSSGRTYYWKIVARGNSGSASSPVWYFRTY